MIAEEDYFYAEQNARTLRSAEEYYRTMFGDHVTSWNLRDRHMVETLEALDAHLSRQRGQPARIVVWAHNSHLGDARATELGSQGELNVGQLLRERKPDDSILAGFTTYSGTVTAADEWGGQAQRMRVRPALGTSFEHLFHQVGEEAFSISLRGGTAVERLRSARLERAIGVIYRPHTERQSHYFQARLSDQFDVVMHVDETRGVEPLERSAEWDAGEVPDTYPQSV
jgi:erythromycin esterase-like protein